VNEAERAGRAAPTRFDVVAYATRGHDSEFARKIAPTFEIILVDDGSRSNAWAVVERIAAERPAVRGVFAVRLSRAGAQIKTLAQELAVLRALVYALPEGEGGAPSSARLLDSNQKMTS